MERLAWVEILDRHGDVAARHAVHAWPFTVGRAYSSDLVLDDPHVAANHLEINRADDGRYHLQATGSINGMNINARRSKQADATVAGSDVVRIGQTQLRIRPLDYAVAAEKPTPDSGWMRRWPALLVGIPALLLAHLTTLWLDYNRDDAYAILVRPLLGDIPVLLLWVGFWALIGRVLAGRANLIAHTVIASLGVGLIMLLNTLFYGYMDFAFNTSLMSNVVSEVLEPLILGTMLYRHIGLVSRMGRRRLAVIVALLMASLIGLIHVTDSLTSDDELARMDYSRTIAPPALLLVHGISAGEFIAAAGKLKPKVEE